MAIKHISAVTLSVREMSSSVDFYQKVGLELLYGGQDASFTSYQIGGGFLNLILVPNQDIAWWGRVILRVEGVDSLYKELKENGLDPEAPRDGPWGERYFHLKDPDGHELSFAELLP